MSTIQRLLTDHIDIWTAAETEKKSGRGRASGNAASVYGIKKLRELILELAMRGKLVPQDASDEPASELLKLMNIEKAKLIASGKIKKGKSPSVISDIEIPYTIPNSWEWLRLPDSYYPIPVSGNQLLSSDIKTAGNFPVIDQGQRFVAGYTDDENLLIRIPGPVIVFGDHTTARKYIDFDFVAGADGVKILRPIAINERFFWLQLASLKLEGRGYARHYKGLNECLFAVPPIWEQTRIVAKINELMALCDQLEAQHSDAADAHERLVSHLLGTLTQSQSAADFNANWQRIASHFDTLFTTEASIDALKQTLLQLAVMGKLVAQDANDEPASELLKRIVAEKEKLVSEGTIKKEKSPSAITEEEKPFILSEGWKWVRFNDVIDPSYPISYGVLVPGGDEKDGIPYVRIADLDINSPPEKPEKSISREVDSQYERTRLEGGEILMGVVGSIGKLGVAPDTWKGANIARAICRIKVNEFISKRYVILLLQSRFMQRNFLGDTKTLAQPTLNIGLIRLSLTPLPPVPEQLRIVGKVDELMVLCDQVKLRITAANQQQKKLADVLVEHAVVG